MSSHTSRTVRASASLAAGATVAGTEWDNSTKYGGIFAGRITNGGSPPTTPPNMRIYVGDATGVKRLFYTGSGDIIASSVTDIICVLPASAMFVNVDFVGGATNAVTADGYVQELTSL